MIKNLILLFRKRKINDTLTCYNFRSIAVSLKSFPDIFVYDKVCQFKKCSTHALRLTKTERYFRKLLKFS